MKVLISGASGLVGTELKKQLEARGDTALSLVRKKPTKDNEVEFYPDRGFIQEGIMEDVDAVVNLGGAPTGRVPWGKNYKKELVDSRLKTTKTLVDAINSAKNPPEVLVSGSAEGIYGDRGDELLTEESGKGEGFLSDLAYEWEEEAKKANNRVVLIRTTLVMSQKGGALGRLIPLIKAFIGGPFGTGKQWQAWISVVDEARAIIHLIENKKTEGAYNLAAPQYATTADLIKAVAKALNRPSWLRVPGWAMKLLLGEAAEELLLGSKKMSADKLLETGFEFSHPDLESASNYVAGKTS
jgi:uncharacterized protein (TIGR01777 family)